MNSLKYLTLLKLTEGDQKTQITTIKDLKEECQNILISKKGEDNLYFINSPTKNKYFVYTTTLWTAKKKIGKFPEKSEEGFTHELLAVF